MTKDHVQKEKGAKEKTRYLANIIGSTTADEHDIPRLMFGCTMYAMLDYKRSRRHDVLAAGDWLACGKMNTICTGNRKRCTAPTDKCRVQICTDHVRNAITEIDDLIRLAAAAAGAGPAGTAFPACAARARAQRVRHRR